MESKLLFSLPACFCVCVCVCVCVRVCAVVIWCGVLGGILSGLHPLSRGGEPRGSGLHHSWAQTQDTQTLSSRNVRTKTKIVTTVFLYSLNVCISYHVLEQCWKAEPNERPDFAHLAEVLESSQVQRSDQQQLPSSYHDYVNIGSHDLNQVQCNGAS